MTTKHTPGPWSVAETRHNYDTVIRGPKGEPIALALIAGYTKQEGAANTALLAAAPDLLEACETFAEWLGREESGFARAGNKRDTPEGEREWRDWYNENLRLCALAQDQARAAIARATGEQP